MAGFSAKEGVESSGVHVPSGYQRRVQALRNTALMGKGGAIGRKTTTLLLHADLRPPADPYQPGDVWAPAGKAAAGLLQHPTSCGGARLWPGPPPTRPPTARAPPARPARGPTRAEAGRRVAPPCAVR